MDKLNTKEIYFSKFIYSNSLFWIIFFSAWLNPVLRLSENNPATVFRLLAPFILLMYALFKDSDVKIFYYFSLFYLYNLSLCFLSEFPTTDSSIYLLNYLYVIILFYFSKEFFTQQAEQFFFKMLAFFRVTLFSIYLLQATQHLLFKIIGQSSAKAIFKNIIYTSVNDLSLALGIVLLVILSSSKITRYEKVFHFLTIAFINVHNDAKSALIAQLLLATALFYIFLLKRKKFLVFAVSLMLSFMAAFLLSKKQISMPDGKVSLNSILVEPLVRIFTLTPYKLKGSVYDRTDSTIFLIQSFIDSKGLGIGAGNSLKILSHPETSSLTALSAHNFLIEWLSEFGWLFLFALIWFFKKLYTSIKNIHNPSSIDIILLAVCLPFFSVIQSSGYISNYIFWLCLFYIYFKYKFYAFEEKTYALSNN